MVCGFIISLPSFLYRFVRMRPCAEKFCCFSSVRRFLYHFSRISGSCCFRRLPLLFLGICFADYGARHEEIPARLAAALIALSCLGWGLLVYIVKCVPDDRIWAYGLYWFPFILIAPGLCIVLSLLAACLDKVAPQIIRGCTFLGGCTLEIYAVHAFAFQVFRDALSDDILYGTDKRWILLSVLSVLFAVLLARVMARLTTKTQKQPAQQT